MAVVLLDWLEDWYCVALEEDEAVELCDGVTVPVLVVDCENVRVIDGVKD